MTDQATSGPTLTRHDTVWVIDFGDGENRLHPDFIRTLESHIDEIEARPAPRALVTTARGKIWSNGLDLDWLSAHGDELVPYLASVHRLFGRFLGSSVPTVAAIQGHAFAAGAMLATAHDAIVMRADRGYFCVPEVDLTMPFTDGMNVLLQSRWSPFTAHEAMTTGRRYNGPEAVAAQIANDAVGEADVLPRAIERAAALAGKDPATLKAIKSRLYANALTVLLPGDD